MAKQNKFFRGMSRYRAIVVSDNKLMSKSIRKTLQSMGFPEVFICSNYNDAVERANPATTHILFDLHGGHQKALAFFKEAISSAPKVIGILITENPGGDAFEFLKAGAKGFLVPPATLESLEVSLVSAAQGSPINEAILQAEDRNEAFATHILSLLYRTATYMKQARTVAEDVKQAAKARKALYAAATSARVFCEHGPDALREKLMEHCIKKADVESSRLAMVRRNLRKKRMAAATAE